MGAESGEDTPDHPLPGLKAQRVYRDPSYGCFSILKPKTAYQVPTYQVPPQYRSRSWRRTCGVPACRKANEALPSRKGVLGPVLVSWGAKKTRCGRWTMDRAYPCPNACNAGPSAGSVSKVKSCQSEGTTTSGMMPSRSQSASGSARG